MARRKSLWRFALLVLILLLIFVFAVRRLRAQSSQGQLVVQSLKP
jgi:preprotein translocase subunit YajC